MQKWFDKYIRNSLRGRVLVWLVTGVCSVSILVCVSILILMSEKISRDSAEMMNLYCRQEAEIVNDALSSTMQSVRFMGNCAEERAADLEKLAEDESYRKRFEDRLSVMFQKIAESTTGAVTFYMRYDPSRFDPKGGFLYSRELSHETLSEGFVRLETTDLSKYSPEDEDVEWFFIPMRNGAGSWISPYWGDNLQMNMISYVEPLKSGGSSFGVVGMDVDFDLVLRHVTSENRYESGCAFLLGDDGDIITSDFVYNRDAVTAGKEEAAVFSHMLTDSTSGSSVLNYWYKGAKKAMVYDTLNNGMKLVLVVDSRELYSDLKRAFLISILVAAAVAAVVGRIGFMAASRALEPVVQISREASKMGAGRFDVTFSGQERSDEVGNLSRALRDTAERLREYVEDIRRMAYQDALTGVRNRAAYEKAVARLKEDIAAGSARFALIMVDFNDLKIINDSYGHERGNQAITNLCARITEVVPPSLLYRVGGDEFVILLEGERFEKRKEILAALRELLREDPAGGEPWENISASTGMSEFIPGKDDSVDRVFTRADEEMYRFKQQKKSRKHRG